MRVLITAQAGHGHFVPLIPLAAALRDAGHDVCFGTSERCRDGLAAHGLELEPCGPAWLESDFGRSSEPNNPTADFGKFLDELVPRLLADLESSVRRRRPDVILSNDFEPAGRVIAERARIPFVLASSGPRLSRALRDERHTHALKVARRLAGLPPGGDLDYSLRWLHLCFAPRDWSFSGSIYKPIREHEESPNEHGICPRVADLGPAYRAQPPPRTPDRRPAVLCTFGTVFNKRAELLRTVIAGVARRAARLVVVLGPGADAAALGPLPGCVELYEQAPAGSFLPHVDYVVTHAGAGTLTALQLHGKPSLLLPQGADQPVNAAACLLNGSSVVRFHTLAAITAGVPPPSEPMTEASVAQAFDQLLADPGYRERAERFRASLEALPPLEHAVELIERLAATRAPVIAHA